MANPGVLADVERALTDRFGQAPDRASVSFVGVDQLTVLRYINGPICTYVTLGMSAHPMSGDAPVLAEDGPRAELSVRLRAADHGSSDAWRQLAVLAAAPAVEGVVYREGMTVDLGQPLASGASCSGVVVGPAAMPAIPTLEGDVEIFELLPATAAELTWARRACAAALRESWAAAGTDLLDLGRDGVTLR